MENSEKVKRIKDAMTSMDSFILASLSAYLSYESRAGSSLEKAIDNACGYTDKAKALLYLEWAYEWNIPDYMKEIFEEEEYDLSKPWEYSKMLDDEARQDFENDVL